MVKRAVTKMVTVVLIMSFIMTALAGCSGSDNKASEAKSEGQESTGEKDTVPAAAESEKDTEVSEEAVQESSTGNADIVLPTKGIGTQMTTEVKADKKFKIACIVKNSTNPYMVGCLNGVKEAAEQMGFEAITMAPSTNDSVEEQVKIMEDLIQTGVDGFVLVPVDTNGIMPGVRKAHEAGIPVACIGTPAAEETFLRTGVDYAETGRVIAAQVAEKLQGKGELIIIEGPPGAQNANERLQGIQESLEAYPDIKIVASQTANFKRTEGMNVTENLIQKYKDVDAIIAANDESAIGAYQAVKAAGLTEVLIAGFDGNQDGSTAIKNGEMFASYNTDPFGSSFLAATYIVQFLNDGTNPEQYFIPFPAERDNPVVTSDTIDTYVENIAWWK